MKMPVLKSLFIGLVLLQSPFDAVWATEKASPKATPEKAKSRFEHLELFNKVLYLIDSNYYRAVDQEKLIHGAIKGMMETLDPHSNFLPKELYTQMQIDTSGEYGGIGIEVTVKDGILTITTPLDDSPAFNQGIKAGDKIVEINRESTIGLSLDEAISRMKGKTGSDITLGIVREGVEGVKQYTLARQIIKIKPVKSYLVRDNFGLVRLSQFQNDCADSVIKEVEALKKKSAGKGGLRGLILDLRSNPGGLLDEAIKLSSYFLKEGIVVSTEGRDPKSKEINYVIKDMPKETELPVIVLVNGSTASAAEIVSGALQDNNRAVIVGTQTFGKGSVQTVAKIDEDNGLKLTIRQYMTPSNKKIQAIGIKPDILLDQLSDKWTGDLLDSSGMIREKDLRNHLTATLESPEETKARLEMERNEREERVKMVESNRKEKAGKPVIEAYNPEKDFQVIMSTNFFPAPKAVKKK